MKKVFLNSFPSNAIAVPMLILTVLLAAGNASASKSSSSFSGEAKDAWITGKLESAYIFNEHLNPFNIDIEVDQGEVSLTGSVTSEIDKELAGRIAGGINGVGKVNNELTISSETSSRPEQTYNKFARWVSDATTSAIVKSKLAANEHVDGLGISVNTTNAVVSLDGEVESKEAKELAGVIAKNTDNVKAVENNLKVGP